MRFAKGNIWDYLPCRYTIVIPTNIGWKKNGENVMGAGLAAQAKLKYPDFPLWLGRQYEAGFRSVQCFKGILCAFPVKPLIEAKPFLSWQNSADPNLIEKSAQELSTTGWEKVALPLVGCGNGGLKRDVVIPILEKYLTDDRFVLVEL